jgi:hypothetical protein
MRLTKQQLINRFHSDEMSAILTAAKTSVDVELWLFRFDKLTPDNDGTSIELKDPLTIEGVKALEKAGLIGEGRADEILGIAQSYAGFTIGQSVMVLPPFSSVSEEVYKAIKNGNSNQDMSAIPNSILIIESFDASVNAVSLSDGRSFDPKYLEAI